MKLIGNRWVVVVHREKFPPLQFTVPEGTTVFPIDARRERGSNDVRTVQWDGKSFDEQGRRIFK